MCTGLNKTVKEHTEGKTLTAEVTFSLESLETLGFDLFHCCSHLVIIISTEWKSSHMLNEPLKKAMFLQNSSIEYSRRRVSLYLWLAIPSLSTDGINHVISWELLFKLWFRVESTQTSSPLCWVFWCSTMQWAVRANKYWTAFTFPEITAMQKREKTLKEMVYTTSELTVKLPS